MIVNASNLMLYVYLYLNFTFQYSHNALFRNATNAEFWEVVHKIHDDKRSNQPLRARNFHTSHSQHIRENVDFLQVC